MEGFILDFQRNYPYFSCKKCRPNDKYCVIITDNIIGATSKKLETAWFFVPLFLFSR